jgi:hypothetical protein
MAGVYPLRDKTNRRKSDERNAREDLSMAATLAVWGFLLFVWFPRYADLSAAWAFPFQVIGTVCYVFAVVGGAVGLSRVSKSELIKHCLLGLALAIGAIGVHILAERINEHRFIEVVLKLIVLVTMCTAILIIGVGAGRVTTKQGSTVVSPPAGKTAPADRTRNEQVVGLLIAVFSLVAAVLSLADEFSAVLGIGKR